MAVLKERKDAQRLPIESLALEELTVLVAIGELEKSGKKATFGEIGRWLIDNKSKELAKEGVIAPQNFVLGIMKLTVILNGLEKEGYITRDGNRSSLTEYGKKELERYQSKPQKYIA